MNGKGRKGLVRGALTLDVVVLFSDEVCSDGANETEF